MDIKTFASKHNWNMPTNCPSCNTELVLSDNHKLLYCPNKNCKSIQSGDIDKWTNTLGIKELGLTTINKLLDNGIITTISSLYKIDYDKITALDGFGEASSLAIKREIESHKEVTIEQFIAGYNIKNCGEKVVAKVVQAHNITDIEDLLTAKNPEYLVCEGVEEITAEKLWNGLIDKQDDMRETLKYVTLKKKEVKLSNGKLKGLTFCFTGKSCMPRYQLQELVEKNGGKNLLGVSSKLNYLVTDDTESGSSKNKKARELNIPILSSKAFLDMLELD